MTLDRPRRDLARERQAEAGRLLRMGYASQLEGAFERAALLYEKSIRLHASAEAHAYLGWVKSTSGQLDEAIEHCRAAISLSPTFANAWNDLGAYLIELGRPDEALFFLKHATRMPAHPAQSFPHYNLHRAYLALGDRPRAIEHLQDALDADPDFLPALEALSEFLHFQVGGSATAGGDLSEASLAGTPVLVMPPAKN